MALAEGMANLACVGARPVAVVNCLNFGNPEHPEVMWQLSESIDGMADACRALALPVIGGNVSLYNESGGADIDPTPVVGVLGLVDALAGRPPGVGWRDGTRRGAPRAPPPAPARRSARREPWAVEGAASAAACCRRSTWRHGAWSTSCAGLVAGSSAGARAARRRPRRVRWRAGGGPGGDGRRGRDRGASLSAWPITPSCSPSSRPGRGRHRPARTPARPGGRGPGCRPRCSVSPVVATGWSIDGLVDLRARPEPAPARGRGRCPDAARRRRPCEPAPVDRRSAGRRAASASTTSSGTWRSPCRCRRRGRA